MAHSEENGEWEKGGGCNACVRVGSGRGRQRGQSPEGRGVGRGRAPFALGMGETAALPAHACPRLKTRVVCWGERGWSGRIHGYGMGWGGGAGSAHACPRRLGESLGVGRWAVRGRVGGKSGALGVRNRRGVRQEAAAHMHARDASVEVSLPRVLRLVQVELKADFLKGGKGQGGQSAKSRIHPLSTPSPHACPRPSSHPSPTRPSLHAPI